MSNLFYGAGFRGRPYVTMLLLAVVCGGGGRRGGEGCGVETCLANLLESVSLAG